MSSPAMGQPVVSLGLITTVAGNGTSGYGGDNGSATFAGLDPHGVAVDSAGNLYIGDSQNNRIRKVEASTGLITTVAGTGVYGYNGDGIQATIAQLAYPVGVALDAAGNLYIGDTRTFRVRKVDTSTGLITTVAGNGTRSEGINLGDGGLATDAELDTPAAVAVDAGGNLYIADPYNSRIRRVDAVTHVITTFAGTGGYGYNDDNQLASSAELNVPWDVAVDSAGNLYIADLGNNRIRKVDAATQLITTVAGNGTPGYNGDNGLATNAELNAPSGVAVDTAGNLYIGDSWNNRVRKVDANGTITTVAGNGTAAYSGDGGVATSAGLYAGALALNDAGNIYIADYGNSRIRKVFTSYSITEPVSPDGGTVSFIFQGNLYNIVYQYPAGFVTAGSTLTVTAFQTPQAQWALRTPVGNPYAGTQLAPVAGLGGDGIIYEAVCKDAGGNPCALHPELSYTITTSWDGPPGTNPGFLKAPIGTNNWENVFVPGSYSTTRTDGGPDPTGGGKSNGGWSDWAFVYNVTQTTSPPAVTIITPALTAIYGLNEVVYASYACSGSYAACVGDVAFGYPIDTTTVGAKTFTVVATVTSGQSASQTVGYTVEATHACLLYDPSRSVKSGAAYPIKVYLCDANGNNLSSPSIILHATSYTQKGGSASPDVMDAGNSNPDNDFRFSSDLYPGGGYIFNYKTTGLHGVYELNFTVSNDTGASHSVGFEVK